jgi:Peptidase family S41
MKYFVVSACFAVLLLPLRAQEKISPPASNVEPKTPGFRETAPSTKPVPQTLRESVDALSEADLKEFLNVLREHYIGASKVNDLEISRATVQGLLDRLAPGASLLVAPASGDQDESPFRSEILDNRIGYLRLGALTTDHLGELDAALQTITSRPLNAAVLDLRATPPGSDFELGAKVCERFCPKGRVLFTVKRPNAGQEMILTSKEDPRFKGVLVVLVDSDTSGAAEVIAAVLRTQAKALVIGQNTKGEAVEFSELPLPSGRRLRLAVAEVALPENVLVFPGGVKPDVPVEVPAATTGAILKAGLEGGVAPMVIETERPRMNEAALVAGTNPELDALQAAQRNKGEKPKTTLRDAMLQRALDAITTIALFEATNKKPAN